MIILIISFQMELHSEISPISKARDYCMFRYLSLFEIKIESLRVRNDNNNFLNIYLFSLFTFLYFHRLNNFTSFEAIKVSVLIFKGHPRGHFWALQIKQRPEIFNLQARNTLLGQERVSKRCSVYYIRVCWWK